MRRCVAITSILAMMVVGMATVVQAAETDGTPTLYGLINKEIRVVTQDEDAEKQQNAAITDVDGFESRIGAKGTKKQGNVTVDYTVELGVNSAKDSKADGIRARIVKASISPGSAGKITIGQDWVPSALAFIKMDPFSKSVGQNYNLDSSYVVGALGYGNLQGVGYHFKAFRDLFSYQTPSFGGLTYTLTYDNNDPHDYSGDVQRNVEHMFAFNHKMADVMAFFTDCESCDKDHKEPSYGLGAKLKFGSTSLSTAYGTQTFKKALADEEDWVITRMFLAAAYNMGDLDLMASYGSAGFGDKDVAINTVSKTTATNYKEGAQTQTAIGGKYAIADKVAMRLTIASINVKAKDVILGEDKKENTATIAALGMEVGF